MTIHAESMHVRNPLPVLLDVDSCPERDVILRWHLSEKDRLTPDHLAIELPADQALAYAAKIIEMAQLVIVRSVMMS